MTDADLLLGRIDPDATFPDLGRLDRRAAAAALARAGVDPEGVVAVVDAAMEAAVRVVTVARGVDPRGLALVAFGGAGPLHACAVADALAMPAVIVPPRAGVLSAVGLLVSPRQRELVCSWPVPDDHDVAGAAAELLASVRALVGDGAEGSTFLDCRYDGQSHALTVPSVGEFHAAHERRNGFARPDAPVEVVALRARAAKPAPTRIDALPEPTRPVVHGPTAVAELDCAMWVPEGWVAHPGPLGAWVLRRQGDPG